MDQSLVAFALLVTVIPTLYLYTVSVVSTRFPTLRNKRICLLIAHPDDEAMFFAPTVLALTRPETGNHVKILCLSSGDAEGLGETRKRELVKSGMVLGLRKGDDVFVVDRPEDFPDSMTKTWPPDAISQLLTKAFAPHLSKTTNSSKSSNPEQPTATIDVLITFDSNGVSSHPNHISLYHGARAFIASLTADKPGWASPVDMYTLTSVSVFRKYNGVLDVFATLGSTALDVWRGGPGSKGGVTSGKVGKVGGGSKVDVKKHPPGLVFMHGFGRGGWATAREAMTRAHVSQMVWFRWGWITISRYMFMNDLRLERV